MKFLAIEPMKYGANEAALDDDRTQPRFIRITDIAEDGSLREDTFRSLPEELAHDYLLEDGDILFARSGATVGKAFVYQRSWGPACYAGYLIRFRCNRAKVVPKFLFYCTQGRDYWGQIGESAIQATIQNVSAERFGDIEFPVPTIPQQQQIVTYLEREIQLLDRVMVEKEKQLGLINEKRQRLIAQAVIRGLDQGARYRDSGVEWTGEIPAHWGTRRIASLFRERDQRGEPHLPLLEVSIGSGVALREFSDDRIESTAADFNSYKVARKGDIVFNKMRMWQGAVGVSPQDGLVSPDYMVTTSSDILLPEFAGQLFRTAMFSAECARHSHGIVWDRLRLYWEGFREIVIAVPPEEEQHAILEHIGQETAKTDAMRLAIDRTTSLLKERRSALIAEAVNGNIETP